MTVKTATKQIRPFVVCAVLRNVKFTQDRYQSFIDLQDKLHQNICRRRTLVAIGTHDLDTVEGPFTYEALAPEDIKFKPLNEEREFDCRQLFHYYKEEKKQNQLKQYLHIIEDSPVYPVIYDSKRRVLSLPPIINGDHSKIKLSTKNVFIECTATDHTKANIVLNTMIAMFSQYSEEPFTCERVQVTYEEDGRQASYPDLRSQSFTANPEYINKSVGINITPEDMCSILERMQLPTTFDKEGNVLNVEAPITRSDILHACDIMEDVAIAYGYNNINRTVPSTNTVGREQPLNKFGDLVREAVAQAGYTEVLTWTLIGHKENFEYMNKEDDSKTAVVLGNPASLEFDIVRTSLLPGLLKTLHSNQASNLPLRIFELGDVCLLDSGRDVGARNARRIAALYCSTTSGFEMIHGLLDRIMEVNEAVFEIDLQNGAPAKKHVYAIRKSDDASFFPKRRADVLLNGKKIGVFGIVHPHVLKAYDIPFTCSALELDLEALF